jgi:hypothetical protein
MSSRIRKLNLVDKLNILKKKYFFQDTLGRGEVGKRKFVEHHLRGKIESHLRPLLTDEFVRSLHRVGRNSPHVKILKLGNGKRVVVKDTKGVTRNKKHEHGQHPMWLRKDILEYHNAIRQGIISAEKYDLRTPKIYFKEGPFVVMEYIDNLIDRLTNSIDKKVRQEVESAARKINSNFKKLAELGILKETVEKLYPHKGFQILLNCLI